MKLPWKKFKRWWTWRRYRKRLGWFARSAFLGRPELLLNPKGIHMEWGVRIRAKARLECIEYDGKPGQIWVGEGTTAEFYLHVAAAGRVTIGRDVMIAGRVYVTDHDHVLPRGDGALIVRPVVIGDGSWLGEGCCVLKGVTLGKGCVVGANAVVTRSFPAGSIVGGVPARLIRKSGS